MHSWNDAGEKKKGRPMMQYIDNSQERTRASLEENVRLTEDRTAWFERSCAAGAANIRTEDIIGMRGLAITSLTTCHGS